MPQYNDYPESLTITDNDVLVILDTETGTTNRVKASTLKTYCTPATSAPTKNLTFASNGDTNGVFYWLGTFETGDVWANPVSISSMNIVMSSAFDSGNSVVANTVNRTDDNGVATANTPNQWVRFDLQRKKLICNYYSIRARQFNANLIRNWKLQASSDSTNWIDLDSQTNRTMAASQWYSAAIPSQTTAYRFFRILSTGVDSSGTNILTIGELELYGTLVG